MKKNLLLFSFTVFSGLAATAQCLTITCPASVNTNIDPASCGATVNYTAPVVNSTCTGAISDTFLYTGNMQTYVVPSGVTVVTIETWGAQGGANWVNNVNYGGYVKADFPVTPGETLYLYVGQQPNGITGGFNGGGNGEGSGQGGGGGTDVRQGGTTLNDRIIVAGGGGGAGYWSSLHVVGGVGGGTTGGDGYRAPDYATNPGGLGASQSGPGTDGTCINLHVTALAGGFGYGGSPNSCGCEGYGGGGGWYGGAASGNCRGGGGGSGYYLPIASNPTVQSGIRAGNGMAVISFNGSSTPAYTQTTGLVSGSIFPVGSTTNTFTASDAFGNTATCSFVVNVTDNEAPVISSIPASVTQANDAGQCGAVVTWAAPTATDNCAYTLSSNYNSGDLFPIGTSTVIYIATDPSGNTDTASFTVTINDNEAPVIAGIPSSVTQANDASQCGAVISWTPPTASDNCTFTLTSNYNPGDLFPIGTTQVMYIATDASGNTDTASFDVTINDVEMPVLTCPAAISVSTDPGMCTASSVALGAATATDNCSLNAVTNDAPTVFPKGTTVVTWTVSDVNGNTTTCTQDVTVTDNEAPVFSGCPSDITMCEGVLSFISPEATDNCSFVSLFQNSGPQSGDTLTAGSYSVSFLASDSANNMSTCMFSITVNPNPTVALNLAIPSTVCFDDANYALSGGSPAGGTWSGNGVSGSSFDPSAAGNGVQTITYTYTDANSGCSGTASSAVTVSPCTGIDENGQQTFSFFPNPASGTFWFQSEQNGTVELVDINGKVVFAQQISSTRQEINIGTVAAGVYMVRYTTGTGVSTGRLMIQR